MTGPQIGSHEHPIIAPCRRLEPSRCTSPCGCDAVEEDLNQDGLAECEESDVFHRTVECVTECFDRFCFLHGKFDHSSFLSLSQTLFSSNTLTECFFRQVLFIVQRQVSFFHHQKGLCSAGAIQTSDGHIEQPHQGDSLLCLR